MSADSVELAVDQLQKRLHDKIETSTGFAGPVSNAKQLQSLFKKFDRANTGYLSAAQFIECLYSLNFFGCEAVVQALFDRYDIHTAGKLDYEEFAAALFELKGNPVGDQQTRSVIDRLRDKIAERGGMNGIRTLGAIFRHLDYENRKQLDITELHDGIQEFGLKLDDTELATLLKAFDHNHDGNITFDEFLVGVRGKINKRRLDITLQAWSRLDTKGAGQVTLKDMETKFDCSLHPEVISGKKTVDQVMTEFMKEWHGENGIITQDEFIDYYKDISASIDNDDYYELVIRNAWHISGGEGWSENTSNRRVLITKPDGSQQVVEIKDDLGLRYNDFEGIKKKLKEQGVVGTFSDVTLIDDKAKDGAPANGSPAKKLAAKPAITQGPVTGAGKISALGATAKKLVGSGGGPSGADGGLSFGKKTVPINAAVVSAVASSTKAKAAEPIRATLKKDQLVGKGSLATFKVPSASAAAGAPPQAINQLLRNVKPEETQAALDLFRRKIADRGGLHGIRSLAVCFKALDYEGRGRLNEEEFRVGIQNFGLNMTPKNVSVLMDAFDRDGSGNVSFDDFLVGLRGELNDLRKAVVLEAFRILDPAKKGFVTVDDVEARFNAKFHPRVLAGDQTEKEALDEFVKQWIHVKTPGIITEEDFLLYYHDVSASIDTDEYFELVIKNAWHLDGSTANFHVLVKHADGSQTVECLLNDLGLKHDDTPGILKKLKEQGVNDAVAVSSRGDVD